MNLWAGIPLPLPQMSLSDVSKGTSTHRPRLPSSGRKSNPFTEYDCSNTFPFHVSSARIAGRTYIIPLTLLPSPFCHYLDVHGNERWKIGDNLGGKVDEQKDFTSSLSRD